MIRVAAVGDIHLGPGSAGLLRPAFDTLGGCADLLLLAGDLTRHGTPDEARVVAGEASGLPVPVVAVLGNHDYQSDRQEAVADELRAAGLYVLEGDGVLLDLGGTPVGIAGTKGFCGGFAGRSGSEFGEPEMKSFIRCTRASAEALGRALRELREAGSALRIALTHYSPCRTPWRASPGRSTRSSAATSWRRRWTRRAPTSPSTATPTSAPNTA